MKYFYNGTTTLRSDGDSLRLLIAMVAVLPAGRNGAVEKTTYYIILSFRFTLVFRR